MWWLFDRLRWKGKKFRVVAGTSEKYLVDLDGGLFSSEGDAWIVASKFSELLPDGGSVSCRYGVLDMHSGEVKWV